MNMIKVVLIVLSVFHHQENFVRFVYAPASLKLCVSRRLPAEILDEIVSYLDASALFTLSFTDKFLHRLANQK